MVNVLDETITVAIYLLLVECGMMQQPRDEQQLVSQATQVSALDYTFILCTRERVN